MPALAVLAGLGAMWAALVYGGGAQAPAIQDPGPLVLYGLPAATLIRNLAIALSLGGLVLACFAMVPRSRDWNRALDIAAAAVGVATVAQAFVAAGRFFEVVQTTPAATEQFGRILQTYFVDVEAGRLVLGTLLALAALTVVQLLARGAVGAGWATAAWAVPLWLIASGGHAGGTEGHTLAVSGMFLHLVFVSIWLGGLAHAGLVALDRGGAAGPREASGSGDASDPRDATPLDVLRRYSTLALASFAVVAFSGIVSTLVRTGLDLANPYATLAIAKAVLLVVLGALGAWQRARILRPLSAADARSGPATRAAGDARLPLRPVAALLAVEAVVMGVTAGVAAGLARTEPPIPQIPADAGSTPAEILTGRPLPPPFEPSRLVTEWSLDPLWAVISTMLVVFYVWGAVRLARRGDRWPLGRTVSWVAGCLLLLWCTSGALNLYQEFQFSLHMLVHMLLGMAVPVLLVPGAPITLAMRAIAKRRDGSRGAREWILAIVHSRYLQVVGHPLVSALIFVVSLWVFYYTPLFEWSMRDHLGHMWMIVHFVGSGYLFVQAIIGIDPGPARPPYALRIVLLLGAMVFHAFFGLTLMTGETLLVADWFGAMGNGLDALREQQVGGGIAWSIGEIPTVILAITTVVLWAGSDKRERVRIDRAADRDGDADLKAYNEMLEKMGKQ